MHASEETPTLLLLAATYCAFIALTLAAAHLPVAFIIAGLCFVIALHASLQHEILHGHPFTDQRLNDAAVFPALGLFVTYMRFKDTHLAHHFDPNLTDPYDDPESNFLDAAMWHKMPRVLRTLFAFNATLLGRMMVGPAIGLVRFYTGDSKAILRGNRRVALSYFCHVASVAIPLFWVISATSFPLWAYPSETS